MWWWIVLIIVGVAIAIYAAYMFLTGFSDDNPDTRGRIVTLKDRKISTDMSRFAARKESKSSESRATLAKTLTEEARAINLLASEEAASIEVMDKVENLPTSLAYVHESEAEQRRLAAASAKNMETIYNEATAMRLDNLTYVEIQRKIHMDRLELERQQTELLMRLQAGFTFQQKDYHYLHMHREYLFTLYDKRKELQGSKDKAKKEKLELLGKHITFMEENFAQRQGLLQIGDGQDVRGSDPDTEH